MDNLWFEELQEALVRANTDAKAIEWAGGSMFVRCTEAEARKLFHRLVEVHGLGHVKINHLVGTDEYAYDFI